MGMLDDAIREHLELKKRSGAPEEEVSRLETEAFGPPRSAAMPQPAPEEVEPVAEEEPAAVAASDVAPEPVPEPPPLDPAPALDPLPEPAPAPRAEPEAWLEDEPDEVPASESLEHPAEPADDDVLEETPDFLQETPEHDRLWFEQKPPRDFDFDE
jgi:hypothetical protein